MDGYLAGYQDGVADVKLAASEKPRHSRRKGYVAPVAGMVGAGVGSQVLGAGALMARSRLGVGAALDLIEESGIPFRSHYGPMSAYFPASSRIGRKIPERLHRGYAKLLGIELSDAMLKDIKAGKRFIALSAAGRVKPSIVLHELSHATAGRAGRALQKMYLAPIVGSLAGIGMARSKSERARKAAPWVAGASWAPILAEEARASTGALRKMRKLYGRGAARTGLKTLGPAFGSYVAMAGGSMMLPWLISRMKAEKIRKQKERQFYER